MTTQRVWRRYLGWLPKPIRTAGWKVLQWLKNDRPGLLMIYNGANASFPAVTGKCELRPWKCGDNLGWIALLNENGAFGPWDEARLADETRGILPEGQYFAVADGRLVAGTGVFERPLNRHPALEIGWVVRHPDYKGDRLGLRVTLAALEYARSVAAGRAIYLYTDDHRLTAIAMYLEIGFAPDLRSHRNYPKRWEHVFRALAERQQSASGGAPPNPRNE